MRNELDPAQPLTNPRHEAFVQALLRGEPATQAYALAGFKPNRANAARLTTNDDITARLAHLKSLVTAQVIAETAIAVADVVEELAKLGFSNMKRYAHIRSAADIAELPEEYAAAVQELTIEEYMEGRGDDARRVKKVRIKLHGKESPLVNIGKHLGMFERDKAPSEPQPLEPKAPSPERLREMRERYVRHLTPAGGGKPN